MLDRRFHLLLCCTVLICLTSARPSSAEVGEFEIPDVTPLGPEQLARLRALVDTDAEARRLAEQVREKALPLLDADPRPIQVIYYEGLVNTDPRRIASVENLKDMTRVGWLMRHWQASGDPRAAAAMRRYVLAWTGVYEPTGNDVNENKFYPLLVAYHALRGGFDEPGRAAADAWVERIGALHEKAVKQSDHFTNRYAKHVRLLSICGMILGRETWVATAHEGVKRFVTQSLHPDGTSRDLKRRDTLTYHCSALRPAIELAMLAGDEGASLYRWTSPKGGSIEKSVNYVVPYALGEKTRKEWVNSQVRLDRRRAEAGLEKYRPGRLFDPHDASELMQQAAFFDPQLMCVVRHLADGEARRFPTWQTLVNAAARP